MSLLSSSTQQSSHNALASGRSRGSVASTVIPADASTLRSMTTDTPQPHARVSPPYPQINLIDVDGLRCEVCTMRSVPHILFSTPYVSQCIGTYVRQLIDDFTHSLLLCRHSNSRPFRRCVIPGKDGDALPRRKPQQQSPTTVTSPEVSNLAMEDVLASDDEETNLLLRLCALEKSVKLQMRSVEPSDSAPPAGWGGSTNADANSGAVTEQLVALFAAADLASRRHGPNSDVRGEGHRAAVSMPPLLSSLSLFKPMLQDMRYLAQHLLLPRYAWQHHQREWVLVHEDVTVTLRDRLSRCRLAAERRSARDGAELTGKENVEGRGPTRSPGNTAAPTVQRYLFSSTELHRLWHTLWKLLGAAWRQRDRLWGAYRYVQGPHRLPPVYLSSAAPYAVPPGVHSSPIVREQHACRAAGRPASAPTHDVAPALEAAHVEDTCAFGPFTSVDIGLSAGRKYVLRHPLAAALRSLRVAVPPTGRDPLATSTAAFSDFQYVGDSASCPQASTARDLTTPLIVPLFDSTDRDVQLAVASAPYLSPEVYLASQHEQLRRASPCRASPASAPPPWPPVHNFSDDVWNTAVVVLEAALSGFCAMDASMCHLALSSAHDRDMNSPDPPTTRSDGIPFSSSSVYSDVVLLLTERHTLPTAAAYNFVYAALHHLQVALKRGDVGAGEEDGDDNVLGVNAQQRSGVKRDGTTALVLLSPVRLAREWLCYLRTVYGTACLQEKGILAEVAAKGLCWRRSERWNALAMAHATETVAKEAAGQPQQHHHHGSHGAGAASPSPPPPIAAITISADANTHVDAAYASGDVRQGGSLPSPAVETAAVHQRVPAIPDTAGVRGAGTSLPHTPQIIRAIGALDTPLLRLLSLGHGRTSLRKSVCSAGTSTAATNPNKAAADAGDLWISLDRYLRRCTAMSSSAAGGVAAPAEKVTGAVGSAASDVDGADGLLRLLFRCLIHATRSWHCVNEAARAGNGAAGSVGYEYTALNHPFFRGFAERGLLTTCMVTACYSGGGRAVSGGKCSGVAAALASAAALPALNLYVPSTVLLATLHELETTEKRNDLERGLSERLLMQATSLRTLIGDDMRAWESSVVTCAAGKGGMARSQQQYPLCTSSLVNKPATSLPPPVHRARRALDHVLSPMEFDLAAQLQHTGPLRRLLHASSDHNAAGGSQKGTGRRAQRLNPAPTTTTTALMRLRVYLKHSLTPDTRLLSTADSATGNVAYSPLYPIPPTLRGEVWGRLLQVPSSAYAREALLAHAVHNTAAKPMEHDRQLSVDIPRCHAYHPLLNSALVSAQLRRILRAWMYLHPEYTYWQGLDSVCAVLLTVSHTDEALVLAQLNAIVERFIAHDEEEEGPQWTGVGPAGMRRMQRASATVSLMPPLEKPSMAELLHSLVVVVRYCDPLLAHHLFDALSCTPELYAISWLLTLFSHTLPARKVYHLWDLLLVEGDINSLVAMCAAVMIHKRERLLSADFSGCLTAFSSSVSAVNVTAAVGDTRWLLMAIPPSVLLPSDKSKSLRNSMDGTHREKGGEGVASVALLAVEDVAAALAVDRSFTPTTSAECGGKRWFHSGVYLVDLRELPSGTTSREVVLGAIHVPLCPAAHAGSHLRGTSVSTARAGAGAAAGVEAGLARRSREPADVPTRDFEDELNDADNGDVGAGWGVVERQEQLQEQHRAAQHAVARRVEEVAAVIVRHLGNPALATILPHAANTDENPSIPSAPEQQQQQQQQPASFLCPWPVHPIVRKMSRAPHVVLLTSGTEDAHELPLAHQLGLKLNACGVHNVSVLRGGVASVRSALPQLILCCASSTQ